MKHIWPMALVFHCLVVMPATLIFLVYSVGASVLLLEWQLIVWGLLGFLAGVIILVFLGIVSE